MSLAERQCQKCASKGGKPVLLEDSEVAKYKSELCPSWEVIELESGLCLRRQFVAKNFVSAVEFLNSLSVLAEDQGHHPDFSVTSYRTVTVTVYTHSLKGLAENDFILAAKCDKLPIKYSPKFLKDNPNVIAGVSK